MMVFPLGPPSRWEVDKSLIAWGKAGGALGDLTLRRGADLLQRRYF